MANAHLIGELQRLGNDLRNFKSKLREFYPKPEQQVTSTEVREWASRLAESWIADLSRHPELAAHAAPEYLSNLNINFQRILIYAERATIRRRYDAEITGALRGYTARLVVPLMQGNQNQVLEQGLRSRPARTIRADSPGFAATAFVGHSFDDEDTKIVSTVVEVLRALGVEVKTGVKPRADRISDKVKSLIDEQHIFVGIFTRRDKLEGKKLWNTSAWVIDEKAYAYGKDRKLILLKEAGVESIGGIQGDYEFLEFTREDFHSAILGLIQLFNVSIDGLRS